MNINNSDQLGELIKSLIAGKMPEGTSVKVIELKGDQKEQFIKAKQSGAELTEDLIKKILGKDYPDDKADAPVGKLDVTALQRKVPTLVDMAYANLKKAYVNFTLEPKNTTYHREYHDAMETMLYALDTLDDAAHEKHPD